MGRANTVSNRNGRSLFQQDRQTVLIASDHALTRAGIASVLEKEPYLEICAEAGTTPESLTLVDQLDPDLLVLDVSLRNGMGIGLIQQCKERSQRLKILVLAMHEEWLYAGRALSAGAMGYISRFATLESVTDAVRSLMNGQTYLSQDLVGQLLISNANGSGDVAARDPIAALTDRERQVFELVGQGLTGQAIARRLKLSHHTVETYRERIKTKLNLKNGADLTFRALVWVLMHE